ncbi:MAG: NUDIX domain-containing protein [Bacteroidetes bacterium]|nr:NUDIX domain-containing protein [Bacteroidota bacterium]
MNAPASFLNPLIPVFRFCPSCGKQTFSPESEKSFSCSACGLRYFINSACAVAVILINDNGELLLTRRAFEPAKGLLDLPGGFVDIGEPAEAAMRREIREELGLELSSLSFLCSRPNRYDYAGVTYYTTDLTFTSPLPSGTHLSLSDEIDSVEWVRPELIPFDRIGLESIREILRYYQTKQTGAYR